MATFIVRHGVMRFLGEFEPSPEGDYQRDDTVILLTERGQEAGDVLCEATPRAVALLTEPTRGQIVRTMTTADHELALKIHEKEVGEFARCGEFIQQRHLPMELVDVEHLFGGERGIFYCLAEQRA